MTCRSCGLASIMFSGEMNPLHPISKGCTYAPMALNVGIERAFSNIYRVTDIFKYTVMPPCKSFLVKGNMTVI